jgi:hypothetical protein
MMMTMSIHSLYLVMKSVVSSGKIAHTDNAISDAVAVCTEPG